MTNEPKTFRSKYAFLNYGRKKDPIDVLVTNAMSSQWFLDVKERVKEGLIQEYAFSTGQERKPSKQRLEQKISQDSRQRSINLLAAIYLIEEGHLSGNFKTITDKGRTFVEKHYGGQEVYGVKIAKLE